MRLFCNGSHFEFVLSSPKTFLLCQVGRSVQVSSDESISVWEHETKILQEKDSGLISDSDCLTNCLLPCLWPTKGPLLTPGCAH